MKLYNLGKVPWKESQLIYHALALCGEEALCLLSPTSPYVCIGFHQDVTQEVDLAYCRQNHIPVFRREVGGGAVYLDGNQMFFQLILHRNSPHAPKRIDAFYRKFLKPIINVHHLIGVPATFKPVNDLVVRQRKISGTGAGEIGDSIVFVGNLILDFDYETMSRVLKIPDEKFRDKVKKGIEENLSTIGRELGQESLNRWDETTLNDLMRKEFEKILCPFTTGQMDAVLIDKIQELKTTMLNDRWLYIKGKKLPGRVVKVRSGLEMVQRMHKAAGGLIKTDFEIREGKLANINITGDFFCFPHTLVQDMEKHLEGAALGDIQGILMAVYNDPMNQIPGVTIEDWMMIIKK
jgi:lipoate-protein ligase A